MFVLLKNALETYDQAGIIVSNSLDTSPALFYGMKELKYVNTEKNVPQMDYKL